MRTKKDRGAEIVGIVFDENNILHVIGGSVPFLVIVQSLFLVFSRKRGKDWNNKIVSQYLCMEMKTGKLG